MNLNGKKLFSVVVFGLVLVPWLFLLGFCMLCYEIKIWHEWHNVKRRTYVNGVWTEE